MSDNQQYPEFFERCIELLIENLIVTDLGLDKEVEIDEELIRKSSVIASYLASSEDEELRSYALYFGILSYIWSHSSENSELYKEYLYLILARAGNLPTGTSLLQNETTGDHMAEMVSSIDPFLGLEISNKTNKYTTSEGLNLSKFQKEIWDNLQSEDLIAISGPTSSGKSYAIQKFIENLIEERDTANAVYVVPTRALITEVAQDLSDNIEEDVAIKTSAQFAGEDDSHSVLVLTPERCLRLLEDEKRENFQADLIFFDEIQSLGDSDRGVLMEDVLASLKTSWPDSKIVVAGPNIENPEQPLEDLGLDVPEPVTTLLTPIFQLKSSIRFLAQNKRGNNRKAELSYLTPFGSIKTIEIQEPSALTTSQFKGSKRKSLPSLIESYGDGSMNLIFESGRKTARKTALKLSDEIESETNSEPVERLARYLSENIHPDYSLVKCLRNGVAYHHGRVPRLARNEVENLFSNGKIENLICTSTLLKGVNLPAEKIFMLKDSKGNDKLTDFEFNNLIGRSGRMKHKLYGTVLTFEAEDEEWTKEKLDSKETKEMESTTESSLNDSLREIKENITTLDLSNLENSISYTIILLRNKFVKDNHNIRDYLEKKDLANEDIEHIIDSLEEELDDLDIPSEILRSNPTVDPLKQEKLFNKVKSNTSEWIIDRNYKGNMVKGDFHRITRNLNEIFRFTQDRKSNISLESGTETEHGDLSFILVGALDWLNSKKIRHMIESRQERGYDKDIDDSVDEVMKLINSDISFVLVRYYKILCDCLSHVEEEVEEWMLHFDQMLEMGSIDIDELELMSRGIDRSVAIDLSKEIPEDSDTFEWLENNSDNLEHLHNKHLKDLRII